MICFGYKNDGITITFEFRGVSEEIADFIWKRLPPSEIRKACEETGHNLIVWDKGPVAEIKKTKSGYIINCAEEKKQ